ncbi:DUF58 domain-containing protein [Actinoplanes sp. CA-015351]|uniref:DUF58 domain-containing protein n=1 Tax=Actinoplanes sp. CA-015351 TaxID=3239897 RepID=UPI003D9867E7
MSLVGWLLYGYPVALALAVTGATLLVLGFPAQLRSRSPLHIEITCDAHETVRGGTMMIGVTTTGRGIARLRIAEDIVTIPLPTGRPLHRKSPPLHRGRVRFTIDQVLDLGPLALWKRKVTFTGGSVTITVRPHHVPLEQLPETTSDDRDGRPASAMFRAGMAFAGLREYEPGDDIRHIDWAASARASDDGLYVRQFAPAVVEEHVIVLDPHFLGGPPSPESAREHDEAFECAVDLAQSFVRAGADLVLDGVDQVYGPESADEALLTVAARPAGTTASPLGRPVTAVVTADPRRVAELRRAYSPHGPILAFTSRRSDIQTGGEDLVITSLDEAAAAWQRWNHR